MNIKKQIIAKKQPIKQQIVDPTVPYKEKIEELEEELQRKEEESLLKNETWYRREILIVLNKIASALEGSSQVGDESVEPDQKYLPEIPDPDPEKSTEGDY